MIKFKSTEAKVKTPMSISCGGIILCGGESRRMGQPKAWLPFAGQTMLAHVVGIVCQVVRPVVVVAAPGQELPSLPDGIHILCDEEKGRGPLQGLAAGLAALEGKAEAAYVSSCDVPFLRPAFIARMIELLGDHAISVPHTEGRHHPLAAVYRIEVLQAVRELIAANRMATFLLFEKVRTRMIEPDELRDVDPSLESLRNLNTPEEYDTAMTQSKPGIAREPRQAITEA